MKRALTYLVFLFAFAWSANAQMSLKRLLNSSSDQVVQDANELYNKGDYKGCIQMLDSSADKIWTRVGRVKMYSLKAKAFLEMDSVAKAENTVRTMLKKNPNYELIEDDNEEDFNMLVKRFTVRPKFSMGGRNTLFSPVFKIGNTFSLRPDIDYTTYYEFLRNIELRYYLDAEFGFRRNFSLLVELSKFSITYRRYLVNNTGTIGIHYGENLDLSELPLSIKKYIPIGKSWMVYGMSGLSFIHLLNSVASVDIREIQTDPFSQQTSESDASDNFINVKKTRHADFTEWINGFGVGYRVSNFRIYLDFRWYKGLNTINDGKTRFSNPGDLQKTYYYVDNDFYLDGHEIGASFTYTFKYKVRKK
jgi:hypothetical protein